MGSVPKVRVFQVDPESLAQMLALRMGGWRERALAKEFQVDKTTIRYWTTKFNILPKVAEIRATEEIRATVTISITPLEERKGFKKYKYQNLLDEEEHLNPGKSYLEYVADHKQRDPTYQLRINPYAIDPDLL